MLILANLEIYILSTNYRSFINYKIVFKFLWNVHSRGIKNCLILYYGTSGSKIFHSWVDGVYSCRFSRLGFFVSCQTWYGMGSTSFFCGCIRKTLRIETPSTTSKWYCWPFYPRPPGERHQGIHVTLENIFTFSRYSSTAIRIKL